MSKKRGKSGGSASAGPAKWESALQQANFNDDNWQGKIYFLQEIRVEDKAHIEALAAGVGAGTRRLFTMFSKEELYNEVRDLGNPKSKKGKETPANYEICEPCKVHLDTDDEIPIHLLVKLLKWKFLTIKTNDQKRREAEKKAALEKEKGGGGKKDKKESKSAKGKGKKTPEPPSPKKESKLRKRGDEDLDSKYIDDEPDDGPNHYILVHGFHLPYVFQLLDEQGITVEATIAMRSQVYPEPAEQEPKEEDDAVEVEPTPADIEAEKELRRKKSALRKFWHDYKIVVENVPEDSNIHDLARLDYVVQSIILPDDPTDVEKKAEFSATLYEDVACLCYDLIDIKRQYKNYLENMKLLPIPPAGPHVSLASTDASAEVPSQEIDMRYYNDLMNTIPHESVSVEMIMHCMLEQIDATENNKVPPSEMKTPLGADGVDEKVAAELNNLVANLALEDSELDALDPEITVKPKPELPSSEPKLLSPHDDIAMRVEHLKEFRGLNAKQAEQDMLKFIPFAGMHAFPRPSSRIAKERSSRLQELIHFCASTGLAHSEIDRALKQFVFECLDLTATDPNGFILTTEGEGAHHSMIPWDDPYPFFKGLLPRVDSVESKPAEGVRSSVSIASSRDGAKSPPIESTTQIHTPEERASTPGILRTSSRISQHSHSAVHFGTDHEGVEILPLQDTPDPEKSIDESMDDIIDAQRRNLDQWCFAEHYDAQVLLQVLRKAMYHLPYYDTYYHKRDHSLMVVLHNPHSPDKQNCNYWENNLHSAVGFRNYLEQVADSIDGWTRAEEAKYQAKVLRSEVDQIDEEIRSASRAASADKKRGRSKSPAKKGSSRGRSTSRSESQERPQTGIGEDFVRADSLKMLKVEMDRIRAEEEEKERQKLEKRARSAQKKASKEQASAEKDKKRPGSKGSKSGSRKSSPAAAARDSEPEVQEEPKEPERYWPFVGYDIGHDLIHTAGKLSYLFPTDGGTVKTERIEFILGTTLVKTTVAKDGHVFSVHVVDPVGEKAEEDEEDLDETKDEVQNVTVDEEDGKEKSETEENEKEVDEKDPAEDVPEDEQPKEGVSKFGSFSAVFRDGLVVAYSSFGDTGKPDKKEDTVEPIPVPSSGSTRSPTPGGKDGKDSPRKREKSTEKSVTPEPVVEEVKETREPYRRPFQKLFLSSPDGLQVQVVAERDCGGQPGSDNLLVRQSYPQKTANLQECEAARLAPAMSEASRILTKEGNVIRTLADGRIEVLFADGTVSTMTSSPLPEPEPAQPVTARATSASTKTRESSESPKKSRNRKGSEPDKEEKEEKKPEGLWLTTLPTGKKISTYMDGLTPVPTKDALVCQAHDPETAEQMYSREDKVLIVHRPDGTTLVEHADGTRITRFMVETEVPSDDDSDENRLVILERIVRIECPGYASVEFNEQTGTCNVRLGGNVLHAYTDASYILDVGSDGEKLSIGIDGTASYFPKPNNDIVFNEPNQELTYFMRHDNEVIFECLDNEGNMFTVTSTGECSAHQHIEDGMESASEDDLEVKTPESKIVLYKQHAPRFFLIHSDGSGTELLRYQDIAEYLTQAESDHEAAVLIDSMADFPNVTGINILRPADSGLSQRWLTRYEEPTIIPNGLISRDLKSLPPVEEKSDGVQFGTALGQGLAIGSAPGPAPKVQGPKCPKVLEHRQLVQFRPVTDEVRETMYDCLREYALFVKERNEASDDMQIHEPRDEEELMHAADLVLQSMPSKADDLSANVIDVYERATAPPEPSPPPTPQPKRCAADWERDRRELEEERENLAAMRNMDVPPYFQSEMGKSFLLSQAPDMDALMRELAQDPRQGQEAAVRTQTPSSPANNYVTGNTPSKLRPTAPTPAHATGECSPAPVRPTAPTPAHATKPEDRPGNPTPKAEEESDSKSSNHPSIPERIAEEPEPVSPRRLPPDVLGAPRTKPVWIPAYLKASRPELGPNSKFLRTEDEVRRKIQTSSVAGATEKGKVLIKHSRGFELLPSRVDFGTLREGYTYRFSVYLKNTGVDSCRFKLEQPPPATGLCIDYQPGPVAAGMKAVLNVEIYALAVGVEGDSGTGSVQHDLRIVTETSFLCLPITAKVLTADDFDNRSPSKNSLPRPGVQLVSTKSPGSQGIIRPRKADCQNERKKGEIQTSFCSEKFL